VNRRRVTPGSPGSGDDTRARNAKGSGYRSHIAEFLAFY
jgi:hypothetical protein